jgi:hypothetical protein
MSDEFNTPNRTFKDGHDPMWTALDKSDDDASSAGGGALQFYNSSAVTTENGYLKISTYLEKTPWNRFDHIEKKWVHHVNNITSGMVQGWNKFCFTGGIVEIDIVLPGAPHIGGLWPAAWMLGNLGRATYEGSTNNIWPWSYDTCDRGLQQAQAISACNAQNHFGMNPFQGRGATEIDIIEVMTGDSNGALPATDPPIELPYCDMTLQVIPLYRLLRFCVFLRAVFSHILLFFRLHRVSQRTDPNLGLHPCERVSLPKMASRSLLQIRGTKAWKCTAILPSTPSFMERTWQKPSPTNPSHEQNYRRFRRMLSVLLTS